MSYNSSKIGVSVIVCCYNSSKRISKTLQALAKQQSRGNFCLEIIIVDNASNDNTQEIIATIWKELDTNISLRIVSEPSPGLGNARLKGINESQYSIVLFCDDDNWLSPNYVQDVFNIMQSDLTIAACGGMAVPIFETEEPYWFYDYTECFALGSQKINIENNKVMSLYGAGLAINKSIFEELYDSGFKPLMNGRNGEKLSSTEDTELTYSFVLMGYKLVCFDDLKFFHFIPKERLTLHYLKNLFIAFGKDGPVRNLYYSYISKRFFHKYIKNWNFHFILSLFRLIKYYITPPKKYGRNIFWNWNKAYIKQLFLIRHEYDFIKQSILEIKNVKKYKPESKITQIGSLSFEAREKS